MKEGAESREDKAVRACRVLDRALARREPSEGDGLQRCPPSIQHSTGQQVLARNYLRPMKDVSKTISRNSSWCTHRAQTMPVPSRQTRKLLIPGKILPH